MIKIYTTKPELLPTRGTPGSAGLDLKAAKRVDTTLHVTKIPTGVYLGLEEGQWADIRPRSGLMAKLGLTCHQGLIDMDYRGEIHVMLYFAGTKRLFAVREGERIAQLVLQPDPWAELEVVDSVEALGNTARGEGGFGSTGMR